MLDDLRNVGHQEFALAVADYETNLAFAGIEPRNTTECRTPGRATLEISEVMLVVVTFGELIKRLLREVE